MMIHRLLDQLKARGLEVVPGDGPDEMKLRGPNSEKTPDVIATLKAFKPQLLEMIRNRREQEQAKPTAGE